MIELGNPQLKSFKSTYIRRVIVDDARVSVHKEIIPQTEELLIRAVDRGVDFSDGTLPTVLKGYDPEGNEKQVLGLYLEIETERDIAGIEDGLGFTREGNAFIYDQNAEVKQEIPSYIDEVSGKIGYRQLSKGATGVDVKFIHYYIGIDAEDNAEFTDLTGKGVEYLQERLGIPQTSKMDWYTWQSILPRKNFRLSGGYAGPKVRALQSALRALGYNCPTTGRFGTETIKFQSDNKLRVTGRVGTEEWNALFDYR